MIDEDTHYPEKGGEKIGSSDFVVRNGPASQAAPGSEGNLGHNFFASLDPELERIVINASDYMADYQREVASVREEFRQFLSDLPHSQGVQELVYIVQMLCSAGDPNKIAGGYASMSGERLVFDFCVGQIGAYPIGGEDSIDLYMTIVPVLPGQKEEVTTRIEPEELQGRWDLTVEISDAMELQFAEFEELDPVSAIRRVRESIEHAIQEERVRLLTVAHMMKQTRPEYDREEVAPPLEVLRQEWESRIGSKTVAAPDFEQISPELQEAFLVALNYGQRCAAVKDELVAGLNDFSESNLGRAMFCLIRSLDKDSFRFNMSDVKIARRYVIPIEIPDCRSALVLFEDGSISVFDFPISDMHGKFLNPATARSYGQRGASGAVLELMNSYRDSVDGVGALTAIKTAVARELKKLATRLHGSHQRLLLEAGRASGQAATGTEGASDVCQHQTPTQGLPESPAPRKFHFKNEV